MPFFSTTTKESPVSLPSYQDTAKPHESSSSHFTEGEMRSLDPWLGLKARLFLSLISYGVVSLIFVGTRLLISGSQINAEVQRSNDTLWSACRGTEQAASTLASFPHLLADNFNSITKRNVDDTVQGLGKVLLLSITAIEELLVFLVDMYRSLFLCVLQFVVQASLSLLISAVSLFAGAVHDAAQAAQAIIQGSVDAINATLSTALGGINDILKIVGQSVAIPTVPQPDLSALSNVTIPNTLQDSLLQLNSSLPTLADLKARIDDLIQTPFESLKLQVNTTINNFSFNQSTLPVPEMQSISYCNASLDTQPLNDLANDLKKVEYIGVGLLIFVGLVFLTFNLLREWYSWRSLNTHVARTRQAFERSREQEKEQILITDRGLMSLLQLSTHPLLADWGLKAAERMGIRSRSGKTCLRWWLAWISHPVGIILLIMGSIGLLSVELQIFAVNRIGDYYQDRFEHMLDSSVVGLQERLDATMQDLSFDYANKSNTAILQAQDDLNDHLFQWVNTTTSTMNDTLIEFMDGIATAINDTFANTPLYSPVQSFVDCIIGQKVTGIERALSWMQVNARASFSTVPADLLMVSPNATQALIKPVQDSALGSHGILSNLIGTYTRALEKEKVMFFIMLLLYLLLFIVGTLIAALAGKDRPREQTVFQRDAAPFDGEDGRASSASSTLHTSINNYNLASPGAAASHQSISKPLHPDVATTHNSQLHHVYHPSQTDTLNNLWIVVNQPMAGSSSWESLLDSRNNVNTVSVQRKRSWNPMSFPRRKSASVDSAYEPSLGGWSVCSSRRMSCNTVQEREEEEVATKESDMWPIIAPAYHEDLCHIAAPILPLHADDDTIPAVSPQPTISSDESMSKSSRLSAAPSSTVSHLHPPPFARRRSPTGGNRSVHLSDISERAEGSEAGEGDRSSVGSLSLRSPRKSFFSPNQGHDVQLHRASPTRGNRQAQPF
ncbi:hypothetical protein CBS101457_006486 [Exobasidium rhododendri]|nr:hypothetical protein CBS101457_006486 [Exobasidium rhododendri]